MTLLKFYADWCGPCKVLTTSFKGIDHTPINVDGNPELCQKYGIRSIPTVIALDDDGKEIGRFTGIKTAVALKSWIDLLNDPHG